ncbi:anti-sigma factor family protein [Kitasatospora sp. NBC_00458]|uniref:anti-sigma factor family protein n=1 Tax=Kitasatospora sp. NBC_00458 TaxID=2903568 RepID=UPI002E174EDE
MTPSGTGPAHAPHLDAGAYVLGALDPPRRAAFEAHLAEGCPQCAEQLEQLGPVEALLAGYAAAVPASDPLPRPDPAMLDRLVAEVAAGRRRGRVRRLVLVAVAAVLAVGGPAVTAAVVTADSTPGVVAVAARQFTATDPGTGAHAVVGVDGAPWGTRVTLELSGVQGPLTCDLVAVSTAGQRQTVTTWSVPATGYGESTALRTTGGTAFPPADLDHFEVRTLDAGTLLVSVPARSA